MKYLDWDSEKNEQLKHLRDISFEEVASAYEEGKVIEIVQHHNPRRYPNQKLFVIAIRGYVYLVPFVEDDEKIFFKTIIPSRKATKKYLINDA